MAVYTIAAAVTEPDDRVVEIRVLRDSDNTQFWVSIWRDSATNNLKLECVEEPEHGSEDYDFSSDAGSIWFHHTSSDQASIVIGMGDIRDLTGAIDSYTLPTQKGALALSCVDDYVLRVYSESSPQIGDVGITPIICE